MHTARQREYFSHGILAQVLQSIQAYRPHMSGMASELKGWYMYVLMFKVTCFFNSKLPTFDSGIRDRPRPPDILLL